MGAALLDLTESNPTRVGLPYPADALLQALAPPELARYEPAPRGLPSARAAVAARHGCAPDDVLLTASTSEAYSYLFKALCDPGDAVLAPQPSYPLFDYLAALEGVELVTYPLRYDGAWHIDLPALEQALAAAPRARAILVVSPNNPTGSYLTRDELARLAALAAARGLVLVADEVFAEYPADDAAAPARVTCLAAETPVLGFSLGGLSKSAGLPQLKLGWIVAGGPAADRAAALERLELVADSYLSVATPVMLAAPRLLELGDRVRAAILARVRANRAWLHERLPRGGAVEPLPAEGGWTATLRFPATRTDEELALAALRDHDVVAHPGYFFDYPRGTYLIVSLLPEPDRFRAGIDTLASL